MTTDSGMHMVEGAQAPAVIRLSLFLRRFIDFVGTWCSFLIVPLVLITIFDVTARKLIWIQIFLVENVSRYFESTLLQEMEWHFHTALFAMVLGFGTIYNRHVRVDLVREKGVRVEVYAFVESLAEELRLATDAFYDLHAMTEVHASTSSRSTA